MHASPRLNTTQPVMSLCLSPTLSLRHDHVWQPVRHDRFSFGHDTCQQRIAGWHVIDQPHHDPGRPHPVLEVPRLLENLPVVVALDEVVDLGEVALKPPIFRNLDTTKPNVHQSARRLEQRDVDQAPRNMHEGRWCGGGHGAVVTASVEGEKGGSNSQCTRELGFERKHLHRGPILVDAFGVLDGPHHQRGCHLVA